jgi:glycolate oxidase iron-sulfur subunit
MRTNFSPAQLENDRLAAAERQLRACVHCGICTATCPTYLLLGDELDGPRGRIQLIQHMLETNATPSEKVVTHIDRCLSCLACVSACPSGVNYPRLIDEARAHIERRATRPWQRRWLRRALGYVLPRRHLLRPLLRLGRFAASFAPLLPEALRSPAQIAGRLPRAEHAMPRPRQSRPAAKPERRVALHVGCVQEVIAPRITTSAIRVLTRHGFEVTTIEGTGCCGSLNHHLGQTSEARRHAQALVDDIAAQEADRPFDAIVTTASGCGTTIGDYGFHLGDGRASAVAARTRDIADILRDVPLKTSRAHRATRVAYHAACSLTHAMKQAAAAPQLLRTLGFDVAEPADTLCCGSAGVYNVLEPDIASRLQARKARALIDLKPKLVATGNIGCLAQIAAAVPVPVVHSIELIDWATGGPAPPLTR